MRVVGLMSGTSLDGIDAALVRLEGTDGTLTWEVEGFRSEPYPADVRARLLDAVERGTPDVLCRLHAELGERLAGAARALLDTCGITPMEVDLIGSHGQTIWHVPPENGTRGATLQLGDPATIAERVGIDVVADFRTRDMAAGGHGAPLVPMADRLLFSHPEERRALQNLGGIGNVTWLDRTGPDPRPVLAFDTGPGCGLIDAAAALATNDAQRWDEDGRMARSGTPDEELVERLLTHPFFAAPPPRSTGREVFGRPYVERLAAELGTASNAEWADLVASLTLLTARAAARAYAAWVLPLGLDAVYLLGGGSRNPALADAFRRELDSVPVRDGSALGIDPDAREAVAFAALAWAHVHRLPGNEARATGARGPRVLGSFTPGRAAHPSGDDTA